MRSRRLIIGFVFASLAVASPPAAWSTPGPGHFATGTGVLPDGSTLGINGGDVAGVGGLGLATLTPPGGSPLRIVLTCVVIAGLPGTIGGHSLGASGIGNDLATYRITIIDGGGLSATAPDFAAVSAAPGSGQCGAPSPAAQVAGDSYLILL